MIIPSCNPLLCDRYGVPVGGLLLSLHPPLVGDGDIVPG